MCAHHRNQLLTQIRRVVASRNPDWEAHGKQRRGFSGAALAQLPRYLPTACSTGDRANALLAAAGYNFSLLLRWLQRLLGALIVALWRAILIPCFA